MAANPITDFDLGPLTWVKTEIDHSLNQARENLDKLTAFPADRGPVKYILTHLHQATGALAMVGLGAATRFNEELEKLVLFLEGEDPSRLRASVAAAKKGIAALSHYLDTLLAGQPDHPMRLLAPYLELNRARGMSDANEGDLFYPNLSVMLPPAPNAPALDEAVFQKALALQRAQYQQGLLRMLKGGELPEALRQMHAAVAAIESLQLGTPNRPFWTAAAAFFDALVFGGLEPGPATRPLFAKLDQQIKQLIDGAGKVAERLFRDLLLAVGRARPVSERITLLKHVYRLDSLIAMPEAGRDSDDEALGTVVRELRELTAQQKDTWLKYTSGNRAALDPFGKQAAVLAERASRLPNNDIQLVLVRLTDIAPMLKAKAIPPSESQSLEVATALLFVESALENYFRLGADFSRQAHIVAERLRGAMAGESLSPVEAIEGGLLDEMTRRAQEKLLIFQVGQEVQVNLQNIEQVLDGFFRDAAKRGDVAGLTGQFAQVQGALMIMELSDAAALNAAVMAKVQQFAEGSLDGTGEAAEMVADGLSALGLYINALQQGAASPRDALMPALLRFGLVMAPELPGEAEVRRTGTVSPLDIEVQKQKVQALYEDWKETPAETTREKLQRAVGDLQRDAAVVSDAAVAKQSEAALHAINSAATPDQTGVFRAIQELAPEKAPEPPQHQVVQLVDAPGAEVDRELLDIFLEEATEVVGTIAAQLEAARGAPHDREALTTIRRGFHTLKGSGRMVGLMDLGEMAWQCEQVMNKWLKDEKPATPALLDFVGLAEASFERWVRQLKESGHASIEGREITARAEALKSDQPVLAIVPPPAEEEPHLEPAAETPPAVEGAQAEAGSAFDFASLDLAPAAAPGQAEPVFEALEPESAPSISQPAPAEAFASAEPATLAEEGDVAIGGVTLPAGFFGIYIAEAEQHVEALDREMAQIEADPLVPVSANFMRAAHTLASNSRTTGFESVAEVAAALEKWLADAMDLPPEFDAHRLEVTRSAVDAIRAMVQSIRGLAMPYPRGDVVERLNALREALREARATGQGTHLRLPTGRYLQAFGPTSTALEKPVEAAPAAEEPVLPEALAAGDFEKTLVFGESPAAAPEAPPERPARTAEDFARAFEALAGPPPAPVPEAKPVAQDEAPMPEPAAEAVPPAPDTEPATGEAAAPAEAPMLAFEMPVADAPAALAPSAELPSFEETLMLPAAARESPAEPQPPAEAAAHEAPAPAGKVEAPAEAEVHAAEPSPPETEAPLEAIAEPAVSMPAEPEAPLEAVAAQPAIEPVPAAEPQPAAQAPAEAPVAEPLAAAPVHEPPVAEAPVAPPPVAEEAPAGEQARPFEAGKDQRKIRDDVDRDLLPIFLDEAREILPAVSESLRRWKSAPADHGLAPDLQRHLHTLKGSARMTGLMRLGELAHILESRINAMDEAPAPSAADFDYVEERVDRFSLSLDRLAKGGELADVEVLDVPVTTVFEHRKDKPAALAAIAAAAQERAEREALPPELRESRGALLRVNAELIDRFVNEAGELSIARSRIEGEMVAFKRALQDLTENVSRMRTQLREIEIASESQMQSTLKLKEESGETFDPLEFDRFSRMQELTRFLAESLGDVITLHQGLQKNLDETELAINAQARLNRELQQGLMGVRLVPLGNLSDRFYRIVRQTAKELEKKANLEIKGTRTELDRSVLEKITAPFEHLLRNAIAHGLETPQERVRAGKPEIGEISIDAVQRGNEVVLTVADDGRGFDYRRIREKAVQLGLLAPDVELPEAQLAQFIFVSGFSTAAEVSQVSGRGVGMDVVRNEITALGGRVEISSTTGRGTVFTITLPLTLAVTQAVMLRAGATVYAVPSVMVEQVQEFKASTYAELAAKGEILWKDNRYPLRSLLPLLGEIDTATPARQIPVLLLRSGVQRAAIRVDEIIGNREVVVKTIGPQLSRLAGVAGATVLGNGQVVLILNPVQLMHRERPVSIEVSTPAMPAAHADAELVVEERSGNPLVMVVDDSLTVRKITSRMLAREGYEVATAKDGVDGLQQLQDIHPDCILLDVEMPRMDGFEFARNVRADPATRDIPIIMITSRTADKHRNHALDLGVNEYMGKPYQEDQLLALIRRYTREAVIA